MHNDHASDKVALRAAALAWRTALPDTLRRQYSAQILNRLRTQLQSMQAHALLAYRAMPSEVDTAPLFNWNDYRIYAPVTHHHKHMEWLRTTAQTVWRKGLFGVHEPESGQPWPGKPATILLCPLTAFDRAGNRLGMGKGCFDFWLAKHRDALQCVIGLAFAGQEVAQIPAEGHDVPLDYVITEQEVIQCPRA
jgi:5-formyltetrahydrofolate cyclo-ligase